MPIVVLTANNVHQVDPIALVLAWFDLVGLMAFMDENATTHGGANLASFAFSSPSIDPVDPAWWRWLSRLVTWQNWVCALGDKQPTPAKIHNFISQIELFFYQSVARTSPAIQYDTATPFSPIELSDHPTRPVTHL